MTATGRNSGNAAEGADHVAQRGNCALSRYLFM
jgi:hypothetical protein